MSASLETHSSHSGLLQQFGAGTEHGLFIFCDTIMIIASSTKWHLITASGSKKRRPTEDNTIIWFQELCIIVHFFCDEMLIGKQNNKVTMWEFQGLKRHFRQRQYRAAALSSVRSMLTWKCVCLLQRWSLLHLINLAVQSFGVGSSSALGVLCEWTGAYGAAVQYQSTETIPRLKSQLRSLLNSGELHPIMVSYRGSRCQLTKNEKNGSNIMQWVKNWALWSFSTTEQCVCVRGLDMQIGEQIERGTSRLKPKWLRPSITPRAAQACVCLCVCLGVLVCTTHFHNCICGGKRSTYSHFRLWFINPSDSSQCTHSFISPVTFFPQQKKGCHLCFSFFPSVRAPSLSPGKLWRKSVHDFDTDGGSFRNNYFSKKKAAAPHSIPDWWGRSHGSERWMPRGKTQRIFSVP